MMQMILNAAFLKVWEMGRTAGYCILAVLLLRLLLRRFPRKYLYLLWLVAAFRLVCPVSVSTGFSLFNLELFGAGPLSTMARVEGALEEMQPGGASGRLAEEAADQDAGEVSTREPSVPAGTKMYDLSGLKVSMREFLYSVKGEKQTERQLQAGTYVWIMGMLVFLLYFLISLVRLRQKVRRAVRVKFNGTDEGRVYECDELSSPFVFGIFRPRIYLPCGLGDEQREMVLLHERYHIRRKDHLVKYLSFGLLAVYWFHPLVWAAWFGMCQDMEMSCDEKVLEMLGTGKKKDYSRTLLALAAEGMGRSRMPLAFGEQDVKKRVRHALNFRKPTILAGVIAVVVLLGVLLLLGTNGTKGQEENPQPLPGEPEQNMAERLYEARNLYVGDPSANGRLLGAIGEAFPNVLASRTAFKTELQTSEEPYEFHFRLEKEPPETELTQELEELDMTVTAVLMLALTDNLGIVQWSYESPEGEELSNGGFLDAAGAAAWCGAEDIKEFAASPERLQDLLDRIRSLYIRPWDSVLPFPSWYFDLPSELYEQAVPMEEAAYRERSGGDPQMFLLAQTEDQTVFVYGCSSGKYGDRGITIELRTPDGAHHYSMIDEQYWGGRLSETRTEVYREDVDEDGSEEIVLRRQRGLEDDIQERMMIFKIDEEGDLETTEIREIEDPLKIL